MYLSSLCLFAFFLFVFFVFIYFIFINENGFLYNIVFIFCTYDIYVSVCAEIKTLDTSPLACECIASEYMLEKKHKNNNCHNRFLSLLLHTTAARCTQCLFIFIHFRSFCSSIAFISFVEFLFYSVDLVCYCFTRHEYCLIDVSTETEHTLHRYMRNQCMPVEKKLFVAFFVYDNMCNVH